MVAVVVLFVAMAVTTVRADSTSNFDFTTTVGQAPTSGVIDCDSVGCPNSISATVEWEGLTFNFSDAVLTGGLQPSSYFADSATCTATAPSALVDQALNGCAGYDGWATAEESDGTWLFALDSGVPGLFAVVSGTGTVDEGAVASGGTFTDPAPTPEPGSGDLLLIGLALLGIVVLRKGIAQGRHQSA
ncbi:MAG: PEP-CTERM sorting domain-containing protein [Candidatus Acidiferrales bacterium]